MSDQDQFLTKAKESVVDAERTYGDFHIQAVDLYIVWFCKTLANWKALISTDAYDGTYWEVTYNGVKQETYVDTYRKQANIMLKDQD